MLAQQGFPAQFIVDQGRSGQQNLRQQWGDWCNIKGAGFGTRPTTNTGSSLIDAIVWVKPGGESDGTSNSSSPRYDSTCSLVRSCPCLYSLVDLVADEMSSSPSCSPMRPCPRPKLVPGSRRTSRPLSRRRTPRCESLSAVSMVDCCIHVYCISSQNIGLSLSSLRQLSVDIHRVPCPPRKISREVVLYECG